MRNNNYDSTVARAALPEIMLVEDAALALHLTPSATRKAIQRGALGRWGRVGRRLFTTRERLLTAISATCGDQRREEVRHGRS